MALTKTTIEKAIPPEQTIAVDGHNSIPALFKHRAQQYGARVAHREKDLGIWKAYSWTDYFEHASWVGAGLVSLGLVRGQPVAILSEDNRNWLYCDMGIVLVGGISTGVYTTDSASQLAYLMNDSGAPFLFIENDEQLDKYLESRDNMSSLQKVIVFERDGLREFSDSNVIFFDELLELGKAYVSQHPEFIDAEIAKANANDTLMLVYTSGTTGPPKGACWKFLSQTNNCVFCRCAISMSGCCLCMYNWALALLLIFLKALIPSSTICVKYRHIVLLPCRASGRRFIRRCKSDAASLPLSGAGRLTGQ